MAEGYHQVHLREAEKPICDICKAKLDTQLKKCLECHLYMCDKCSIFHKEVPASKNHTIISKVERGPILEISRTCSSHPRDEVLYYCNTCKKLICSECIIGIHSKHRCIKMKAYAIEKRQKLKTHLDRINNTVIPKMTSKVTEINEKRKQNNEKKKNNFEKLKERKSQILSELENINKKLETECQEFHQSKEYELLTKETKLTQDLSEINTIWSKFNKILHTGSDLEVIQAEHELSEKLESITSSDTDTEIPLPEPTFIEGKTNDKILEAMYGSLDIGELGIIKQFSHRSDTVFAICPLTDETVFIHYLDLYDNHIITVDGEVQQTIKTDFKICDIIMTSKGDIMSTPFTDEPKIYRLTKEGAITETISTAPLLPIRLCESRDGNLLVNLVDERSYNIKRSSRRCVSRITMKGKVLQSYEYNKPSGLFSKPSRLFTCPRHVSENINGDVCVVNLTGDTTGHLIILDSSGQLKSTYIGQQLKQEFCPRHVKCDKLGNIILSDFFNQAVHLLDIKGRFIRYVVTENDIRDGPFSLAIDNKTNRLWVGGYKGNIYIVRYLKV